MKKEVINILITYDQQLVADGLEAILAHEKDINVLKSVCNKEDIFHLIPQLAPDIIIIEYSVWLVNYAKLLAKLCSLFTELKIIIISELISEEIIKNIMPFIHSYLLRTCSSEKVIFAVHEVYGSGKYLCTQAIDEYFKCSGKRSNDSILSLREKEVLWIESKTNNEIADNLNISESTVRTHLKNIREKLGHISHLQMMIYACQLNIANRNFNPICPNCRSYCS